MRHSVLRVCRTLDKEVTDADLHSTTMFDYLEGAYSALFWGIGAPLD